MFYFLYEIVTDSYEMFHTLQAPRYNLDWTTSCAEFLVAQISNMKKYCDHENIRSTAPEEFTHFQHSRM